MEDSGEVVLPFTGAILEFIEALIHQILYLRAVRTIFLDCVLPH